MRAKDVFLDLSSNLYAQISLRVRYWTKEGGDAGDDGVKKEAFRDLKSKRSGRNVRQRVAASGSVSMPELPRRKGMRSQKRSRLSPEDKVRFRERQELTLIARLTALLPTRV